MPTGRGTCLHSPDGVLTGRETLPHRLNERPIGKETRGDIQIKVAPTSEIEIVTHLRLPHLSVKTSPAPLRVDLPMSIGG